MKFHMVIGLRETLEPVIKPVRYLIGTIFIILFAINIGPATHDLLFHGLFSCPTSMEPGSVCAQLAAGGTQVLIILLHLPIVAMAIFSLLRFTEVRSQSIWRGVAVATILAGVSFNIATVIAFNQGMARSAISGPTLTDSAKLLRAASTYAVFVVLWGATSVLDDRFIAKYEQKILPNR